MTVTFTPDDIRLPVFVGWSGRAVAAALAAGAPVPKPVVVTAILDTAANATSVSAHVVQQLGLAVARTSRSHTAAGTVVVNVYEAAIGLPTDAGLAVPVMLHPQLEVSELKAPPAGADVLLGLDVLLNCVTHIDGPALTFTLDV